MTERIPRSKSSALINEARRIVAERRRRGDYLNKAMFGEPAWDILLELYIRDGVPLSIGKLVALVGEPKTTILRWIDYLEKERLVARDPDLLDRRLVQVALLDRGRTLLDAYLRDMRL